MEDRLIFTWISSLIGLATSGLCFGFSVRPSADAGLMQQPTSQYYHAVRGGHFDAANEKESLVARIAYTERPEFIDAGYRDRDFAAWIQFGQKLVNYGNVGISAFAGAGEVWGYIKDDKPSKARREDFSLPGLALSMEASSTWDHFDMRLGHSIFAGQKDKTQLESFVVWPYTFFYLSLATPISFK